MTTYLSESLAEKRELKAASKVLFRERLLKYVEANPDSTLQEIATALGVGYTKVRLAMLRIRRAA